jgi:beta-galactosidase
MLGYHPCGQNTGEWFYDRSWENLMTGFEAPMQAAFRSWVHDPAASVPTAAERRVGGLGALLDPDAQRRLVDFLALQQAAMEEPLEYFARIIKEETRGRKLVVLFYGYTFEISALPGGPSASGHLALQRLLDCPDVDIICSPISYFERQPGGAGPFMAPIDSVQLHGKLWLNEDDTRTYLSSAHDDFGRAGTLDETIGVHDRNFAQIASRGAACWWMDLPGAGWLDSPEIWDNCHRLNALYEALAPTRQPYRPEVAVVVDEASLLRLSYGSQVSNPLLYQMRHEIYRMGLPVGFYLLSDVCAGRVEWPKVYLLLDAFALDDARREALLSVVRRPGKTAVWFYAPGFINRHRASEELIAGLTGIKASREAAAVSPRAVVSEQAREVLRGVRTGEEFGPEEPLTPLFFVNDADARQLATYKANGRTAAALKQRDGWNSIFVGTPGATPSLLREIARVAGAHVYLRSDDVVVAGDGILAVHATAEGEKVLHLPNGATAKDVRLDAAVTAAGKTLRFPMRRGETRTFIIERSD